MDAVFLKFRGFVDELVSPVFTFELKKGAWYQKSDLVDLTLHTALMNSYAEGLAETLRQDKHVPTSETLLDYFKAASVKVILDATEKQIGHCVQALKKKGITLKNAALAFDWHDQPYYGSPHTEGVVGTKPNRGTSYAFSFLTVSVITPKKRLVLAILPLKGRTEIPKITLDLLRRVATRYLKRLDYVTFDSGFQNSVLLNTLARQGTQFILPLRQTVKLKKRWKWSHYAHRFIYRTHGVEVNVVEATDAKGYRYFLATNLSGRPKAF